ncbi:MAG: glycosyltransferase [Prevotella sp.]|nr:glycosyltransferase [Prevotella sp.]
MKILQISLSLGGGGAERIVTDLSNRLVTMCNHEVVILTILDDRDPRNVLYMKALSPKVRVINLHCESGLQAKALWGVFKTIKREKPSIVHNHFSPPLLLFPVFGLSDISYIQTIHNLPESLWRKYGLFKKMVSSYLYKTQKIQPVTISPICQQSYRRLYKVANDICIINGSEPLKTTEAAKAVKAEIEEIKPSADTLVFIHVARHAPQKNHARLLDAFCRLEKDGYDFILLVVGDNYGSLADAYKDNKHIFFMGLKDNVGDYMAQADFFVLSSDYEGLPMTMLEAMSMGVIPISTPAGGVVDVIEDGKNGYITADFDEESFYQKIKQAINEKGRISPETIKDDYEKSFSMKICAEAYYKAYQNNA